MSQRTANCPNCGAPIQFRWSSAVQTTCEYCKSILVRHDVDLTKVGEVADLPLDGSPIQIGTEGIYRNKGFVAIGRIVYEYADSSWNEWHLMFHDGTSGWLSDAQLDYAVSFWTQAPGPLPPPGELQNKVFNWNGVAYHVTTVTKAHYRGVQGELPFEYWEKTDAYFADLRTADGRFATIDYSETPPLLFLGEPVEFDDLKLKNVKEFEGWSA